MNTIFIISDTLFQGEFRSKQPIDRPKDYEQQILRNLKEAKMQPNDTVIHLGGISFNDPEVWIEKMKKASGVKKWILLRGEKDKKTSSWYLNHGFSAVLEELVIKAKGGTFLFTNKPYYGSTVRRQELDYNVHGNTLGTARKYAAITPDYDTNWHVEMALEKTNYKPVPLSHLLSRLLPKKVAITKLLKELKEDAENEGHND